MRYYVRDGYQVKHYHLVSGIIGSHVCTFCGRFGFNHTPKPEDVREKEPEGLKLCLGCARGRDHHLNVGGGKNIGGVPVSSGALGTGKRKY